MKSDYFLVKNLNKDQKTNGMSTEPVSNSEGIFSV